MIGTQLIQAGLITEDQLRIVLTEQETSKRKLGELLLDFGFVNDHQLTDYLASSRGIKSIDLSKIDYKRESLDCITKRFSIENRVISVYLNMKNSELTIAIADPTNLMLTDKIRRHVNGQYSLRFLMASSESIDAALNTIYRINDSLNSLIDSGTTAVELVNYILGDAVDALASDIHLEPEISYLRIRYRIDGVLKAVYTIHKQHWPSILGRIKVLSSLDLAVSRQPQDGGFSYTRHADQIDFRVSTFPTINGESFVLRLLKKNKEIVNIRSLGFERKTRKQILKSINRGPGLVLVTGPTGSGKTTTLYAIVEELKSADVNIITLEDPVEYMTEGVRQSCVKEGDQFDYKKGIRAIMRQDPDIILIGEIRDEDSASMAIRAAMTGHKVISTLHTKDAYSAVERLIEFGLSRSLIADNLSAVVAQRLLRRLCPTCKDSKYRGRFAIAEVLVLSAKLQNMIVLDRPKSEVLEKARSISWESLYDNARRAVLSGDCDIAEVERVLGAI